MEDKKISRLRDFLAKNTIAPSEELPAVHTTPAFNLKGIMESSKLDPRPCNAFVGESLSYFFYGKPSYKAASDFYESKQWEMPICLLMPTTAIPQIKRIYPFDSGAFIAKKHPDYIRKMDISDFEAAPSADSPPRIIGAFFDSIDDFFRLKPKSADRLNKEFSLNLLDAHIMALRELAADSSLATIDDRRFAIEIQTEKQIPLNATTVDAVVLPDCYFKIDEVRNYITQELQAEILMYSTFSLAASDHTALVYDQVYRYLAKKGIV